MRLLSAERNTWPDKQQQDTGRKTDQTGNRNCFTTYWLYTVVCLPSLLETYVWTTERAFVYISILV